MNNILWSKIEKLLKENHMSIYQLTIEAGLPKNNRTMYEFKYGHIKKPSFELMCRIADALDVSLDVFRERR
ncbi:helix-turn-helix domain-containing protein [Limosilactobacillus reuteri]|uniref:helix-turn-helix domain-containing protein n=1 Tax=Limosilactobacillus reuteri TaxID=1598 RepID=UPI00385753B2